MSYPGRTWDAGRKSVLRNAGVSCPRTRSRWKGLHCQIWDTLSTRLAKDAHLPQATGSRNPQCAPLMGVQAGKEGSFSRPGRRGRPVPGGALEMGSSFCSHQSKGPGARITGEAESRGTCHQQHSWGHQSGGSGAHTLSGRPDERRRGCQESENHPGAFRGPSG